MGRRGSCGGSGLDTFGAKSGECAYGTFSVSPASGRGRFIGEGEFAALALASACSTAAGGGAVAATNGTAGVRCRTGLADAEAAVNWHPPWWKSVCSQPGAPQSLFALDRRPARAAVCCVSPSSGGAGACSGAAAIAGADAAATAGADNIMCMYPLLSR